MKMRVSALQYPMKNINSFEEFAQEVTHYVKTATEFDTEFLVFPEFLTTQLISFKVNGKAQSIEDLPKYTESYIELFSTLAKENSMHIIGGTHVIKKGTELYNVSFLFKPDGTIEEQAKLHMTPTEVNAWKIKPGQEIGIYKTEKGNISILTCYDMEFPEIVRMARAKGADVIFCPSCTDNEHGFYRVRYCCHARTIENQIYVVNAVAVGSLSTVDFMRSNFGKAAIITPNDIPFPPGGILAEGQFNQAMLITADLDIALLHQIRQKGSVNTWRDRRVDLYPDWKGEA